MPSWLRRCGASRSAARRAAYRPRRPLTRRSAAPPPPGATAARPPKGARSRPHRASPAAVIARHSVGAAHGCRRALSCRRRRRISRRPSRPKSCDRCRRFSMRRSLPNSLHRAAAPRCRLSAASRAWTASTERVAGQVDRLAVTDDAVLIADYKTDASRAAAVLTRCRRRMSRSSRFTARCWRASIRQSRAGGVDLYRRAGADRDPGRELWTRNFAKS